MFSTPNTFRLLTTAASRAFCFGRIIPSYPSSRALMAMGNAPFMPCKLPSRLNSPIMIYLWSFSSDMDFTAANMPMAKGKS